MLLRGLHLLRVLRVPIYTRSFLRVFVLYWFSLRFSSSMCSSSGSSSSMGTSFGVPLFYWFLLGVLLLYWFFLMVLALHWFSLVLPRRFWLVVVEFSASSSSKGCGVSSLTVGVRGWSYGLASNKQSTNSARFIPMGS